MKPAIGVDGLFAEQIADYFLVAADYRSLSLDGRLQVLLNVLMVGPQHALELGRSDGKACGVYHLGEFVLVYVASVQQLLLLEIVPY